MDRRGFLKTLATLAVSGYLPLKTIEKVSEFMALPKVEITNLGFHNVVDPNGDKYYILRIHLSQWFGEYKLETFCEIDNALLRLQPNIPEFIRAELEPHLTAMKMEGDRALTDPNYFEVIMEGDD